MKKVRVTGVQILTRGFYEIFESFFQFFKINFVTKSTGLQYLKESYRYPNFFTYHRSLKLCHSQMVFTQILYLHKQGLQDQNKGITNCAEFTLQ
jgi:hypothetical protein